MPWSSRPGPWGVGRRSSISLAEHAGAMPITTSPIRLATPVRRGAGPRTGPRGPAITRQCWSSARERRACPRRSVTPTARWPWPPPTGCTTLGLGPDDRFQVATPPSHILGLLNLLAAATAGATVRLHPRFDLDDVLPRIESASG